VLSVARSKQKQNDRGPQEIRHGSFVARLYPASRTVGGKAYHYFRLTYHTPDGLRKVRDFRERDAAVKAAKEAMGAFSMARPDALAWSPAELAELDAATKALEGTGASLFAAVQGFIASHSAKQVPPRTVAEVAAELAKDREGAGCSEEHVRDITKRLEPFAKAFQCQIASVTPPLVREYLTSLRGVRGQPLTGRSRDNARRMIVSLFNFARQQRYIPRELAEEIAEIPPPVVETPAAGIFTPEAFGRVLGAASGTDQALLAIGAFAGLRAAELHRLEWQDIRLAERVIVLAGAKTKTASRRVIEIQPNLAEWLAPDLQPFGRISRHAHEHALSWALMKIARAAGVPWVKNGMRHSFCSYRLAVTKNAVQVAHEAGNSPAMVFKHYRELVTEAQGKAWFDIRPEKPANVIAMPATA